MSCLGGRLADLVDGRLDGTAREQVLAHVARCESCRDEVVATRSVRAMLAGTAVPAGDDLADRLALVPVTAPLPIYRGSVTSAATSRRGSRRARGAVAIAGGATAVAIALAWAAAGAGAIDTGTVVPAVIPPVDRYSAEHAASTDRFPLTTPGSSLTLVSYGAPVGPGTNASVPRSRVP